MDCVYDHSEEQTESQKNPLGFESWRTNKQENMCNSHIQRTHNLVFDAKKWRSTRSNKKKLNLNKTMRETVQCMEANSPPPSSKVTVIKAKNRFARKKADMQK